MDFGCLRLEVIYLIGIYPECGNEGRLTEIGSKVSVITNFKLCSNDDLHELDKFCQ